MNWVWMFTGIMTKGENIHKSFVSSRERRNSIGGQAGKAILENICNINFILRIINLEVVKMY